MSEPLLERLPPSNVDAEQAVIGALLLDRDALARVSGWLQPDDFSREGHRFAYEAMLALNERNEPADIVTLTDEIERRGQLTASGGVAYLHSLATVVPTAIHVEHYARIVTRTSLKRRLISVAGRLASVGYDDAIDSDEALDEALGLVESLTKYGHADAGIFEIADISEDIDELYDGPLDLGESTGWPEVDDLYRVRRGEFAIVSGIPGCGKSEWVDAVVVNLARAVGWKFAMCSPENWPLKRHAKKLIEKYVEKPFYAGRTPRLDRMELVEAKAWLHDRVRFIMPDEDHLTVSAVLGQAAVAHAKSPIDGLVIDPWNELDHQYGKLTETQYISESLTKIRRFARRFGVHVWLVAHPTKLRVKEDGTYPVPTPYDISGSAHWRNKADSCLCVHRDLTHPDYPEVQIHVQKVRFDEVGNIGVAALLFDRVSHTYQSLRGIRGRA